MKKIRLRTLLISAGGLFVCAGGLCAPDLFRIDESGIRGEAEKIPLSIVVETLGRQTGFRVFLDEELENLRVSFRISSSLPYEEALQRIIHPHGLAVTYVTKANLPLRVETIYVFKKGRASPTYRCFDFTSHEKTSAARTSSPVPVVSETHRSLACKKILPTSRPVKRNIFGAPVSAGPHPFETGPARPGLKEKRAAYGKYLEEKKDRETKTLKIQARMQRLSADRQKNRSRGKKEEALFRTLRKQKGYQQ